MSTTVVFDHSLWSAPASFSDTTGDIWSGDVPDDGTVTVDDTVAARLVDAGVAAITDDTDPGSSPVVPDPADASIALSQLVDARIPDQPGDGYTLTWAVPAGGRADYRVTGTANLDAGIDLPDDNGQSLTVTNGFATVTIPLVSTSPDALDDLFTSIKAQIDASGAFGAQPCTVGLTADPDYAFEVSSPDASAQGSTITGTPDVLDALGLTDGQTAITDQRYWTDTPPVTLTGGGGGASGGVVLFGDVQGTDIDGTVYCLSVLNGVLGLTVVTAPAGGGNTDIPTPTATAVDNGNGTFTVTITPDAAATDGTSYQVTVGYPSGSQGVTVLDPGVVTYTTGVLPSDTYTVVVTAVTDAGTSAPTDPITVTVTVAAPPAGVAPGRPTGVHTAVDLYGTATVAFTPGSDGGDPAGMSYTVTCTNARDDSAPVQTFTGSASPVIIAGALSAGSYFVHVAASNSFGSSAATDDVAMVIEGDWDATETFTNGDGGVTTGPLGTDGGWTGSTDVATITPQGRLVAPESTNILLHNVDVWHRDDANTVHAALARMRATVNLGDAANTVTLFPRTDGTDANAIAVTLDAQHITVSATFAGVAAPYSATYDWTPDLGTDYGVHLAVEDSAGMLVTTVRQMSDGSLAAQEIDSIDADNLTASAAIKGFGLAINQGGGQQLTVDDVFVSSEAS